jgi:hypothetical protein
MQDQQCSRTETCQRKRARFGNNINAERVDAELNRVVVLRIGAEEQLEPGCARKPSQLGEGQVKVPALAVPVVEGRTRNVVAVDGSALCPTPNVAVASINELIPGRIWIAPIDKTLIIDEEVCIVVCTGQSNSNSGPVVPSVHPPVVVTCRTPPGNQLYWPPTKPPPAKGEFAVEGTLGPVSNV